MEAVKTKEPQYAACFGAEPVTLGPMASEAYRRDPKRLVFTLARYKFVAKMIGGMSPVAEIGCGDGFGSRIVAAEVGDHLDLVDFDETWKKYADEAAEPLNFIVHDIALNGPIANRLYRAIYALDVLEHIAPSLEIAALSSITRSLRDDGVFIAGCPSLESQTHASAQSRAGHVNCKTGAAFQDTFQRFFQNVFIFSMSDEVVHTGFSPMAHYRLALCVGPKR
jgi:SAM-dependent methyltransferase